MAAIGRSALAFGDPYRVCLRFFLLASLLPLAGCGSGLVVTQPSQQELLTPLLTIQGGWLVTRLDANGMPLDYGRKKFRQLRFPVALAARGNDLYIADAGANRIYRHDTALQALIPLPGSAATPQTRLQVAPDNSLYVLDPARSRILRMGRGGQLLQSLDPVLATARYREFALDDGLSRILVLDQLNQQLVELQPTGNGVPLSWADKEPAILGAMALSAKHIYVIDEGTASILVLTREGRMIGRVGQSDLVQPRLLAIDHLERVYVADIFDRSLKVFHEGRMVAHYPPARLGVVEITGLALERDRLFIADGAVAKVVTYHLNPAMPTTPR
jgi:hypothetical protein